MLRISELPPKDIPMELLLEADPCVENIIHYLPDSFGFSAREREQIVGACIIRQSHLNACELMNIAVLPQFQKQGIGTRLLRHVIQVVRESGAEYMEVGTGTFGYQLGFYQKEGFRVVEIIKDHFLTSYPKAIYENGIQHKDMLRLRLNFRVCNPPFPEMH